MGLKPCFHITIPRAKARGNCEIQKSFDLRFIMIQAEKKNTAAALQTFGIFLILLCGVACTDTSAPKVGIRKNSHIVLLGNNLGSRMMNFGHFETAMQLRYPDSLLFIRNMCDGGNTPGFRPHSARNSPWAFPGAEKFQPELAHNSGSEGHFESPDQWLTNRKADIILAFVGDTESYQSHEG